LYIEAVEYVYGNSNKVLLDAKGGGNLLYLPVDKLLEQGRKSRSSSSNAPEPMRKPADTDGQNSRSDLRSREVR
jgi:membrane protease subunit HflK